MEQIPIDNLIQTAVEQGASDLHMVVGQPAVCRLLGRIRKLKTKTLEPEDTVGLMKSITPEANQRELEEKGSTDFRFVFRELARFRVSIFKQRANISMVLRQVPPDHLPPEPWAPCE